MAANPERPETDPAAAPAPGEPVGGPFRPLSWYAVGGVLLLAFGGLSFLVADEIRWGLAKGIACAVVGACYLVVAYDLWRARRGPARSRALAIGARVAAVIAWVGFIAVWIAERVTR